MRKKQNISVKYTENPKKYQSEYYKNNKERLKQYKKQQYLNKKSKSQYKQEEISLDGFLITINKNLKKELFPTFKRIFSAIKNLFRR
jgi:hypothetical protein